MSVDVSYQGVILQRGSEVRQTPAGLYVALELPMPVGTALALDENGRSHAVQVARVHEGIGPGVIVAGASLPQADVTIAAENVPQHQAPAHVPLPVDHAANTAPIVISDSAASPAPPNDRGVVGAAFDDGPITAPSINIVSSSDFERPDSTLRGLSPDGVPDAPPPVVPDPDDPPPDDPPPVKASEPDRAPDDGKKGPRRKRKKTLTGT